jgi:glycosyltransferase involved in cell wall biosynthesis
MIGRIVGDGSALRPWQDLFHHIDHVPQSELAEAFRKADVFVFPTLVEGMPLAVIEAMASGLPVITTPNGPGDIVRDGVDGFLVPPRNVDAIVERLEQLRANHDLRASMGQAARSRALGYTWSNYRENMVKRICQWIVK